jgi:uncharacterized membrane protein
MPSEMRALAYATMIAGGFLVITYLAFAYFAVWRHEFLPVFPEGPRFAASPPNDGMNLSASVMVRGRVDRLRGEIDPWSAIFSPQALGILISGALMLSNGVYLLGYLRRKEHKDTKKFVISSLLTDEEKAVYEELSRCGGQATQKQLSTRTGFGAVKTYRVIRRLEEKKVVKGFPFGMPRKIILNEA